MAKISIYNKDETDFSHNGIILKDTTECIVEEELNGKYLLELSYPVFGNDKHLLLKEENIIKADGQLFRIHSSISNLGYIEVKARHIFYDLLHNFLEDVRPTDLNGNNALNWILDNTQYPHKFRGVSDVSTINTQYYIRKNPVEAILGSDSLSARWGGELVRDNFTIKLLRSRGANKGAQIAYGKNLMGLEVEKDMDSVATRIMPVGNDGLLLPEKYIDSPLIDNYNQPYIKKVEIDIGVEEATDDKEGVTQEEAFDIMRQKVSDLYEFDKVDIPYVNIKADLALLENTEEYKHLKHLVKVELGDIVACTDNPLNIEFEAKVIRVKKDVLSNKNVEVELGQFKKGLSDTIEDVLDKVKEEIEIKKSDLEKAIENATDLITSALGGYVVKRAGEILIMDEEDPLVATRVWRWNLNGLGYSSNGVNGPYRLAMTMDGSIVADFITTGVLNASLLKTGLIKPQVGDDFINMENGHFKLGGMEQDSEGFRIKIGTKPIGDFVDDKVRDKVSKNDIISSINLDYESASIKASKINLVGAVTVLSDITGNLGTITAGTIDGINLIGNSISGGTININSGAFRVWSDGDVWAANGNFRIDPAGDGVYNSYANTSSSSDTSPAAARWKRSDGNYFYQDLNEARIYIDGRSRFRLRERDGISSNWALTLGGSDGATIKAISNGIQIRSYTDARHLEISASDFKLADGTSIAKTYSLLGQPATISSDKLDVIKNTKIYEEPQNITDNDKKITLLNHSENMDMKFANIPKEISNNGEISMMNTIGVLWSAVQELSAEVDELKGVK